MSESTSNSIRGNKLRLNQVLAIESGVRKREYGNISEAYKAFQKLEPFVGFVRSWTSRSEDEPKRESQVKVIVNSSIEMIKDIVRNYGESLDITATKDWGNQIARADIKLDDGTILMRDVPVSYLLFLEKQLTDLRSLIEKLPLLDPARRWQFDQNSSCYISTDAEEQEVTRKVSDVIVKYPATPEHPAQTEMITLDKPVGKWKTTHMSSALPRQTVLKWKDRLSDLEKAVKIARENANMTEITRQNIGQAMLSYVFSGLESEQK